MLQGVNAVSLNTLRICGLPEIWITPKELFTLSCFFCILKQVPIYFSCSGKKVKHRFGVKPQKWLLTQFRYTCEFDTEMFSLQTTKLHLTVVFIIYFISMKESKYQRNFHFGALRCPSVNLSHSPCMITHDASLKSNLIQLWRCSDKTGSSDHRW